MPPPPDPSIPAGNVPMTGLIKFGRAQNENYFDNGGRYVSVRRTLSKLCGDLLLNGLVGVQNPEDIAEYVLAVKGCVRYHFRMIASVSCKASGPCIDTLWRCGIERINSDNQSPFRIEHNPLTNPLSPWLKAGGASEFYQVVNQQGNVLDPDIGFKVLHEALTQTM